MIRVNDNKNFRLGKHLTYEECIKVEDYKALDSYNREIVDILGCAPQTINSTTKNATVRTIKLRQKYSNIVYKYEQYSYPDDATRQNYLNNRYNCEDQSKWLDHDSFNS